LKIAGYTNQGFCPNLLWPVLKVDHDRGEASEGIVVVVVGGRFGLWTDAGLLKGPAQP